MTRTLIVEPFSFPESHYCAYDQFLNELLFLILLVCFGSVSICFHVLIFCFSCYFYPKNSSPLKKSLSVSGCCRSLEVTFQTPLVDLSVFH